MLLKNWSAWQCSGILIESRAAKKCPKFRRKLRRKLRRKVRKKPHIRVLSFMKIKVENSAAAGRKCHRINPTPHQIDVRIWARFCKKIFFWKCENQGNESNQKRFTEGSTLRRIHKPYVGLSSVKITRRYPRNGQMALLPHFWYKSIVHKPYVSLSSV